MKDWRAWTFQVEASTQVGEVVGVTGSCLQLGNWRVMETPVLLTKVSSEEPEIWKVTCVIPTGVDVHYRYYVSVAADTDKYVIKRREVSLLPRVIPKDAECDTRCDRFGETEDGGGIKVDRGWLTFETVIQFKLFGNSIQFWKQKLEAKIPLVKMTPVNLIKRGSELHENSLSLDTLETAEAPEGWPITEVMRLSDDSAELLSLPQFGVEYHKEDYVLFQVQVYRPHTVAYLVDFYMHSSRAAPGDPPSHIGFCYILPDTMTSSEGHMVVPITSTKHRPIGQLSVYYVIVKPIPDYECSMEVSYAKHWKHNRAGLDVGHRGMGPSFKQKSCAELRENTIASLKEAASHGADFVEFDVQLSKDMVPVIYHDFHVAISLKRKNLVNAENMLEIPLKELTLEQLQSLKVYHVLEGKENQQLLFDEHLEEHQPFPTLQHALEILDPNIGFNIEIKWTMMLKDGTFELNNPFEVNKYLDCMLKVVLEHGGSRKIVFSCFHPDICTMVRYKQPIYPVIFLTQGMTAKYPMYHDPRCHTVPAAVHFALSCGILGINVHTEDILKEPSLVKYTRDQGLVIFCWGEDNNCPETICYLKELGLHAVIYDKIDEFGPKRRLADKLYTTQILKLPMGAVQSEAGTSHSAKTVTDCS